MNAITLTDAKLSALKPPASGQLEISDAVVPGLRVRVGASGGRTFIVRKRVVGRVKTITLGRYSQRFGLADARKKARLLLSDIEAGGDPSTRPSLRKREAIGKTVRTLWPDYRAAKADRRSIKEIERVFNRHILPHFGDRIADTITRAEITRFIDDEIARTAPVQARNVLSQLSSFYSWALPRLDGLPANPCRDAGRPPAPKPRDRVLTDPEIAALWKLLDTEPAPFGPAIKLLILTGQRRSEVFEADRDEFDLTAKLWTIPRHRAKNGVTHLVPLSEPVMNIIVGLAGRDDSDKLFPARGNGENGPSGFSKTMVRLRTGMEEALERSVPHWTLHDLRRTLATGLQRLGVRLEVTEAVLNHVSGSRAGIVGVYQRHDYLKEKREALEIWAEEVLRLAAK